MHRQPGQRLHQVRPGHAVGYEPRDGGDHGAEQVQLGFGVLGVRLDAGRGGQHEGLAKLRVERAQNVVENFEHVGVVGGDADALGRVLGQHFVEGFLDAQRAAGGHDADGARHGRLALLLLERVGHHEEGVQADGHPFWRVDEFDGPGHGQQVEDDLLHGEVKLLLHI